MNVLPNVKFITVAACLMASSALSAATTITIVNADGPGEGFNDPTIVAPVGGNPGSTLGEQRLKVFEYAASIWAARIHSDIEIKVEANFNPLSCNSSSAVVGSAGATTVHRNFAGAPLGLTWYPQALANSLAGTDLSPDDPDLGATFNSSIDNNDDCLRGINWYLGLDGNAGMDIDLADVVLHEIGHGLGFASYVNESTGQPFLNYMDVYSTNLEDHSLARTWDQMTNNQRANSAVDSGDLHFVGGNTISAYSNSHAPMYAPNPARQGSSVSHFDTSMNPDELMEPFIADVPIHDPGLAEWVMLDLGWAPAGQPGNTAPSVTITSPATGDEFGEDEDINLNASATDEDGDLSNAIAWHSSLNGDLGSGASLVVNLGTGDHLITASATDSQSVTGSDQVSITVNAATATAAPVPPSNVTINNPGNGSAEIFWDDNSDNENRFDIVRESPHKKREGVWVGSTLVASVAADTITYTDTTSGTGTFRYCVSAVNSAGSSAASCSETREITDSSGGGGSDGGSFCDSKPQHRRCQ